MLRSSLLLRAAKRVVSSQATRQQSNATSPLIETTVGQQILKTAIVADERPLAKPRRSRVKQQGVDIQQHQIIQQPPRGDELLARNQEGGMQSPTAAPARPLRRRRVKQSLAVESPTPPSPVEQQQQQQVQGVQPTAVPTPVVRRRQTPRKKPTPVATPPPSPVATPVPIMAVAPLEQPVQPSLSMPTPVVRKRQAPRRRSVPTPSATPPPSPVAAPVVPVAQQQQQVQEVQPTAVPTPVVRRRQTPRKKPTPVATPPPSPVATPVPIMAVAPLEQPVQPSLSMPTPVVRKRQAPRRRSVPTPSATPPPSPVAAPVVPVAQQQQQVQGVQPTAVPTPVVRRRQTPRKKPTPVATPPPSPVATPVPIMAVAPLEQPVQPSLSMPTPVVRKRQAPRRRSVPTPSATPPPSPVAAPVVPVAQQQQQVQGVQPTAVPTPVVRRRQTPRKKPTPVATPLPSVAEKEQEQFPATKSVMTEQEEQSTPPPAPVARRKQQPRKRQTSSPPPLPTAVEVPGVEESPNTPPSPPPTPVVRKRQPLMVHEEMLPYVLVEEEEDEDGGKVELQQPASQPSPVVPASSVGKSEAVDEPVSDEHTSMTGNTEGPDSTLPPAFLAVVEKKSGVVPDHREKVLTVFQKLSDINIALQERYKAHSYQFALERLKRDDYIYTHLPPHIMPPGVDDAERRRRVAAVEAIPNIGDKLKTKIVEILTTGDLEELHGLQAKPVIKAIRELTQIHGVGPRTAVVLFKKYGLKTVEEVEKRIREQEAAQASSGVAGSDGKTNKGGAKKGRGGKVADGEVPLLQLTEAQRCGLKYHSDFAQRIPHEEVRLHEAFLKLRLRKYLGKSYELSICGSYRRRLPTSGDIDVLLTRRMGSKDASDGEDDETAGDVQDVKPQEVLAAFVDALKKEHYIEATLAQGATKFMGVSRLKSYGYNTDSASPKMYPARRLDIRFVEPECFPAALLYFTGSKTFNVVMRAEAIKQNFVLNEYGLFHNELPNDSASSLSGEGGASASRSFSRGHWNAEAFQKLVRAHYYSSKSPALAENNDGSVDVEVDDDLDAADSGEGVKGGRRVSAASQKQKEQQQRELHALWQEVEARRVKVRHERDIFAALGMPYVLPEHRSM